MRTLWLALPLILMITGCESTYYNAMEKVGVHKRDILVDRIEDVQDAQEEGQEQFQSALAQFKAVVNFDGGELEGLYNQLNDEYEDSADAADNIRSRIDDVESVAEALFEEWQEELSQYSSANLRRDSERKLKSTQRQYKRLLSAMRNAEKSIDPVLKTFKDNVLYLKHNLNARAISTLKGELSSINNNVASLLKNMQRSINESDKFIKQLKGSE
jgi:Protein of unknown function (DUF2959)